MANSSSPASMSFSISAGLWERIATAAENISSFGDGLIARFARRHPDKIKEARTAMKARQVAPAVQTSRPAAPVHPLASDPDFINLDTHFKTLKTEAERVAFVQSIASRIKGTASRPATPAPLNPRQAAGLPSGPLTRAAFEKLSHPDRSTYCRLGGRLQD